MNIPKLHQPVTRKPVVLPKLHRNEVGTGAMAASQSLATAASRPPNPQAGTGAMASSFGIAEQLRKKNLPTLDLTHISASGKGTWNQQLKTGFTDALNAGVAEGLGHFKTGFAGLGKLIAETKPQIKGTVLPALPDLAEHMDGIIQKTEEWIADNTPNQMTAFQRFAKDLTSGAVSIFGSIGLGLVTGSAGLSAAVFGATQTGSKYIEERKAGLSPERAGGLSSLQGGIEASLEGIGLDTFLRLTKGVAWNTLVRAATEAVQEGSQQFGENLVDRVWNKDKALSEGVLRSALIGGLLGIPAAVSVSAYEQSQPFTQAVREVVSLGYSESRAIAIVQQMVEDAFNTVAPAVETAVNDFKQLPAFAETTTPIPMGGKAASTEVLPMGGLVEKPVLVDETPFVPSDINGVEHLTLGTEGAKGKLPPVDDSRIAASIERHARMSNPPAPVIDHTVITPTTNGLVDITDRVDMASVKAKWPNADHVYLDPKRRTVLFKAGDVALDAMGVDNRYHELQDWFGIDAGKMLETLKSGGKSEVSIPQPSVSPSPQTNPASVDENAPQGAQNEKAATVPTPKVPWQMTQQEWDAVQNPLDIKPLKPGNRIVYHVLLKKETGKSAEETIADTIKNGIRRENTNTGIWVSLDKPVNDFADMFVIELPESDLHIMNQQEAMVEKRDILPSDVRAYYPSFRASPHSDYTRLDTSKFDAGDTRQDWIEVAKQNGLPTSVPTPSPEIAPQIAEKPEVAPLSKMEPTPAPQGVAVQPVTAATVPTELQPPSFREWRFVRTSQREGKLVPNGVGQKFTPEQIATLRKWVTDNGMSVDYNGASATGIAIFDQNAIAKPLDLSLYGKEGIRREESALLAKQSAEKDAARKTELASKATSRASYPWILSTFGDALGVANSSALSDLLEGNTKKFNGVVSEKWVDGLTKIGAITPQNTVDWAKLKSAYITSSAIQQSTPAQSSAVAPVKWGKWIEAVGSRRTSGVGTGKVDTIETPVTYRLGSGEVSVRTYAPEVAADRGIEGPWVQDHGKMLEIKGNSRSYYLLHWGTELHQAGYAYVVLEARSGQIIGHGTTPRAAIGMTQELIEAHKEDYDEVIERSVQTHGEVANTTNEPFAVAKVLKPAVGMTMLDISTKEPLTIMSIRREGVFYETKDGTAGMAKPSEIGSRYQLQPAVTNDAPAYSMSASGTSSFAQGTEGYTTTVTATNLKDPRATTLKALTDISASLAERTNVEVSAIQQAKKLLVGFEAKETADLKDLLTKVKSVLQEGKKAYAAKQHAAAQKKATLVEQITKDVQPFVKTGAAPDQAAVKKWWAGVSEAGKELDLVLSPMDRIEAAMHTTIKRQLDGDYSEYLLSKRRPEKQAFDLIRKHRLTPADGVAIKNYAILQQGRTDILAAMGIDPKTVKELTEGQRAFYTFARKWYDFTYPHLEQYLKEVYNKQLGHVKNYWPLPGEGATADSRIEDRFFDREALYTHTVSMEETRQRTGKFYESTTNAFEDFFDYVDDAAYLLSCGKDIKEYSEAVNTPAFNKAAGDLGQTVWLEWLDLMARKGGTANSRRIRWLDTLRNNVGIGVMGFKLSTVLLQFTALADGMTAVHGNPAALVNGALALTDPKWREFLTQQMPEVTEAQGNDPAIGDITKWKKWSRTSFAPLVWADAAVRRTIAMAAYLQRCEELGVAADPSAPNENALEYAQRWTRVTQGSSMWKDQPLAVSRGLFQLYSGNQRAVGNVSLGKTLLQFQSFMLFRWANIKDTIWTYGLKHGNLGTAASGVMWLLLIAAAAEIGTRRLSKEAIARLFGHAARQDDGFFKEMYKQQVDNVPFVGSIMNAIEYDGDFIPAYAAAKDLLTYGQAVVTRKTTPAKIRAGVQFIGSVGTMAGVPGARQMSQFVSEATYKAPAPKRGIRVPRLRPKRR